MSLKDMMQGEGFSSKSSEEEGGSESSAKMEVLKELRKMASQMMGEGMDDKMSQVTVAADDSEGLEEGLEMAGELVESKGPASGSYEPEAEEVSEESEDMSMEELEAKIAELMQMKEMMEG